MDQIVDDVWKIVIKALGPKPNKKDNTLRRSVGNLESNVHAKLEYKFNLVALQRTNRKLNDFVNKM